MNREKFSQAMLVLGEVYNEPITATRMQAYANALKDLPEALVLSAIQVAIETCNFFPRPAEIRQIAVGNTDEHADKAWGTFLRAMRDRTVRDLDPHTQAGVASLGFSVFDLAQLDVKQLANLRQTFRRGYMASLKGERLKLALSDGKYEIADRAAKELVETVTKRLKGK